MTTGICRNPTCLRAARAEPTERYPGPGEFCPECGERLESIDARLLEAFFPPAKPPRRKVPSALVIVLVGLVVAGGVGAMAAARRGPGAAQGSVATHVCPSSMTRKLAFDIVSAYAATGAATSTQFQLSDASPCDVRFSVSDTENGNAVVARDAIVAVVNPQNTVVRLSEAQLRGIFSGTITDWSQVGGVAARIVPFLPENGSDEARIVSATLLRGTPPAPGVLKLTSSAEVVRAVTSASTAGRSAIGLVALSASPPAKVLALGSAPQPSPLAIAARRYPLTVTVTVRTEGSAKAPTTDGLMTYAYSGAAESLAIRDGFVTRRGF